MIKTWQQRCEEHPDHDGIVSEGMIRQRMQEEIDELRQALAQPEQEPVDKNGSPCSEFWDWLPKAYNFDGDGSFTKYNMEVAFLAGKQSIAQQPPIAFMGTDFEGNPTKFRLNPFSGSFPLYAAPPKREWVGLSDEEIKEIIGPWGDTPIKGYTRKLFDQIEAKLREKNA
jgi:hypothetical protein